MMTKFHFPAKEASEGMEKTDTQKVQMSKIFFEIKLGLMSPNLFHNVLLRIYHIFTEDYLPHGKECENNPYKRDYNPCKEGWYCADDDLCNSGGLDCCKPKLQLDDICDDHKDCQDGLYCADKRDVGGRYDLCRPVPKKYSHLTICDKDYDCPKQEFCDERNCPREFDADCCGGKKVQPKQTLQKSSTKNINKTHPTNKIVKQTKKHNTEISVSVIWEGSLFLIYLLINNAIDTNFLFSTF